ncbi:hypothetical protein WKW77_18270 [Variovorax ureilyticus]|uniref:Transmembrane protein n=1 Tax=Variovorax ureilyticus TaxID=1836198 RepID=A0ABU8VH83_9BURK
MAATTAMEATTNEQTGSRRAGFEMARGGHETGAARAAQLASGLGAIVLGAGLALVSPPWLRNYAMPLLVVGAVVHGLGMSLNYRLESRNGPPLWWERALFWACWVCLTGLGVWIAASVAHA